MKSVKLMIAVGLGLLVSGCATMDTASRNTGFDTGLSTNTGFGTSDTVFANVMPSYRVEEINVAVPDDLVVSEANVYYPSGDIVWHGDPAGDRPTQVAAIFDEAFSRGTQGMQGEVPVILDVTVQRFHALTPKTRYTVGGVHSIRFTLALRDAETGLLLEEPRSVKADLKGFGGQKAIDAEREGMTQKVRITNHLATVIVEELRDPEGFENPRLGLVQVINNRF